MPKIDDIKILQKNLSNRESILQRALEKFSLEKNSEKNQRSKEEIEEEERQQMALIDWHDFVVVETIDFADEEILPPPSDPNIVHTMSIPLSKELINPVKKEVKVDKGVVGDISAYTQKCPVCRDMIPVDDFQEHIKLELIDPNYKLEKEAARIKDKQQVFATSSEIYRNLQNLSKQRPDLKDSNESVSGNAKRNMNYDSLNTQFNHNLPSRFQALPMMDKSAHRGTDEILPNLVPEKQWAQMHPGAIPLHIQIPNEGGDPSWGFHGQILQISVDINQRISDIKALLSDILGGMPLHKMKLKNNLHSVFKDINTLAHYNLVPGCIVELTIKERGGRRKNY